MGNNVFDDTSNDVATRRIGSFLVNIPGFIVRNTLDDGLGSLRDAVRKSNANTMDIESIEFDPNVFNAASPQIIQLTTGELTITDTVNITGPGSSIVTVRGTTDAGTPNRVFNVEGAGTFTVSMSGMRIDGGRLESKTDNGAGLRLDDETVNGTDLFITNNKAAASGAGVAVDGTGTLNLVDSTVSGNTAVGQGLFYPEYGIGGGVFAAKGATITGNRTSISYNTSYNDGGGIYAGLGASLSFTDSSINGNSSGHTSLFETRGNAGAILLSGNTTNPASLSLVRSTIAKNSTIETGGGILFTGEASLFEIKNSTVSSNKAAGGGGGALQLVDFVGTAQLHNSTFTQNTSGGKDGGAISRPSGFGIIDMQSSVSAQNIHPTSPDVFINNGNL
ncbi:MAG: hypothetical protein ACRCZF_19670, partial [Gemmataceae bacterium]